MHIVTVSDKGQVVIPAGIRRQLGIHPGCQLSFSLNGSVMQVHLKRRIRSSDLDAGYGLLKCEANQGERRLSEFDVAEAMRKMGR